MLANPAAGGFSLPLPLLHPSILPGFPLLDYTLRYSGRHFPKKPAKAPWDGTATVTARAVELAVAVWVFVSDAAAVL